MKKLILKTTFIVLSILFLLTACTETAFWTEDTDVLTVFLYNALTGVPVPVAEITKVEVTNSGRTSTITTGENAAGEITSTSNTSGTVDTSLKFYDFHASEQIKILVLTSTYNRFEAYVTLSAAFRFPVYAAYMIPASTMVQSPSYTYEIQDTAAAITAGGKYIIIPATGTALDLGINLDTTNGPSILLPFQPPNWGGDSAGAPGDGVVGPLYGIIPATGQIVIPVDTLFPGVVYSLYLYDIPGYQDQLPWGTTLTPGTTSNAATIVIDLTAAAM